MDLLAEQFKTILIKYNCMEFCGDWSVEAISGFLPSEEFFSFTGIPKNKEGIQALGELREAKRKFEASIGKYCRFFKCVRHFMYLVYIVASTIISSHFHTTR
jgi:hypothetical protein